MLVIWGRSNSVNVQKVLWFCEEISLAYERKDAGGAYGVVNTPEYLKLNPNALVPAIVDDGFVMWESNAIVRYLADRHDATNLWPRDRAIRAHADQWMDWSHTTLWPAIRPLFMGLIRTPPEKRDARVLEDSRHASANAVAVLDRHFASNRFAAGDTFTIGDIPIGCVIWRWMNLPVARPETSNVARWFDALKQRSAYQHVVMHPLT